jgi:cholesterol transport system auxiliary component
MRRALALACLLGAVASGCFGGLERRPPEKQRFMLQPTAGAAAVGSGPSPSVLRVARVRVSPVFDQKGFVYRTGASTFETDFYNEFFSPPGVLLREALLGWLDGTRLFSAVARSSSSDADFVLETDVDQLFADQRGPGEPKAYLEIVFRLIDARTRKIAFEKRYSASESAADDSPAALIDAWNRGLGALLAELAQDVRPIAAPGASAGAL